MDGVLPEDDAMLLLQVDVGPLPISCCRLDCEERLA